METIYFATNNSYKFEEAKEVAQKFNINIEKLLTKLF